MTDIVMGSTGSKVMALDVYGRISAQRTGRMDALRQHEFDTRQKHEKRWEQKFGELSREELRKFF